MSTRIAIVTGTSSGIGRAAAQDLLRRAWTVVGVARRGAAIGNPAYHHLRFDLSAVANLEPTLRPELEAFLRQAPWERVGLVNNAASLGQLRRIVDLDPAELLRTYAVNVVAPTWLMGFLCRAVAPATPLRIVNVSSGAAGAPFPGLADYGSSKAALRLVGASLATAAESTRPGSRPRNLAVLSYEPGVVETDMQVAARAQDPADFPSSERFRGFARAGVLVPPEAVVGEITAFLEAPEAAGFTERRYGTR
jgi:benzil reductase ((S)-benzoin forming)